MDLDQIPIGAFKLASMVEVAITNHFRNFLDWHNVLLSAKASHL
jgi:hypothetical protein